MSVRQGFKILLSSGSGKAGVILLLTLVLTSIFVLVRLPLDFGNQRWNNPAEWADNPKSVAPEWMRLFGGNDSVRHKRFRAPELTAAEAGGSGHTFTYDYDSSQAPTFISFSVSDVRFHGDPPVLLVDVLRPDGRELRLLQTVVRGARSGETSPITRYGETPLRVLLSANQDTLSSAVEFLRREFQVDVTTRELQGNLEEMLFGTPDPERVNRYIPLAGQYRFTVRALVRDPADSVGEVKLVVAGTHYGVIGTDGLGRDLALGLLFGFPVALTIGLSTALLVTIIGTFFGILSGYMAGKTDTIIQRFADVWSNIPLLPILIFLIFILGQKLWLVVVILIVFGWPGLTIVVRSMVLQIRTGQLVEATQALGASRRRIMFRHILFQISPFVFAQMIFFTPAAILAEAGLSFLGLGDPSIPTWGQILESSFRTGAVFLGYWWWILPPGLLIVITAMTFVFLTLGLEPVLNPRLRSGGR
ncbi:MAG: ABC transporter permease [Chloroflexi bacterium]|nr:ABC transporter permease [Chloroflexota bacterium]